MLILLWVSWAASCRPRRQDIKHLQWRISERKFMPLRSPFVSYLLCRLQVLGSAFCSSLNIDHNWMSFEPLFVCNPTRALRLFTGAVHTSIKEDDSTSPAACVFVHRLRCWHERDDVVNHDVQWRQLLIGFTVLQVWTRWRCDGYFDVPQCSLFRHCACRACVNFREVNYRCVSQTNSKLDFLLLLVLKNTLWPIV